MIQDKAWSAADDQPLSKSTTLYYDHQGSALRAAREAFARSDTPLENKLAISSGAMTSSQHPGLLNLL